MSVILQLPGHTQADCEASVCACTGSVWGRDGASVGARDNLSHLGGFPEIKERGSSIPAWAFHEREARRLEGKIGRQGCQCAIIPIHKCMYVRTCVRTYVRRYVCMYVCM